jgi:hypothetical protein
MSSNVGLSTPRGSGTSGYVQRNLSHLKPRDSGYGAPYPPIPNSSNSDGNSGSFKQRKPDRQILEHDRRRAIEVRILEERDRLEEENEKLEEAEDKVPDGQDEEEAKVDEDGTMKQENECGLKTKDRGSNKASGQGKKVKLSEEEIEERLDALRARLVKDLEDELAGRPPPIDRRDSYGYGKGNRKLIDGGSGVLSKERRQFKTYQVHELAEAKIEESERLRMALGIRGEGNDTGRQGNGRSWRSKP